MHRGWLLSPLASLLLFLYSYSLPPDCPPSSVSPPFYSLPLSFLRFSPTLPTLVIHVSLYFLLYALLYFLVPSYSVFSFRYAPISSFVLWLPSSIVWVVIWFHDYCTLSYYTEPRGHYGMSRCPFALSLCVRSEAADPQMARPLS